MAHIKVQEINAEMHFKLTTMPQIPPVFKSWFMDPTWCPDTC